MLCFAAIAAQLSNAESWLTVLSSRCQILGSVASPLRRAVLQYAVRWKQAELSSGIVRNNSFWDLLLFNRIQVRLRTLRPHCAARVPTPEL